MQGPAAALRKPKREYRDGGYTYSLLRCVPGDWALKREEWMISLRAERRKELRCQRKGRNDFLFVNADISIDGVAAATTDTTGLYV